MAQTEIIVVANGCTDSTVAEAASRGCTTVVFDQPIGFPKAVNAGIKAATGEYLIVLNNDVRIQAPDWIDILTAPFADPLVGVTGPMKERSVQINQDFILFFCVCISRRVIDKIGLLDEIFSPGYSEDIDFCCRAERAGFKIVQVPDESHDYYAPNRRTGRFPIYHAGNETFKDVPDPDLIHRNHAIVVQRYGINIGKAQKIDGMMSDTELKWLAEHAKKAKVIIELGSWIGRSARALADNMPEDAVLYCVDTWLGSEAERQGYMNVVSQMNGDFAAYHCITNLWDHISKGRVRPIRMHGRNAAQMFREQGLKADLIFIDAGHIFHEVKEDIACFLPILAKDGILCGHDFNQPAWPDVTRAVREYFPQVKNVDTIWAVESPPPSIFDCFTFNNELDLLEKRLSIMHDAVDRFVLVEATVTHSGKPKSLVFNANLDLFQKYLNKITYVVVEDSPVFDGSEASAWAIEQHQRNAIMRALTDCRDDYLIIVSDLDEIPNPAAIHSLNGNEIASLEMELLLYDGKVRSLDPWLHAKILTYRKLKELTPCGARYAHEHSDLAKIPDGGQHLSWTGGVDSIIEKIHNTAHRNIDTDRFTDRAHIQNCIDKGLDLFDRDIKYEVVR